MLLQFPPGRKRMCESVEGVIIARMEAHESFQIWTGHNDRSDDVDHFCAILAFLRKEPRDLKLVHILCQYPSFAQSTP